MVLELMGRILGIVLFVGIALASSGVLHAQPATGDEVAEPEPAAGDAVSTAPEPVAEDAPATPAPPRAQAYFHFLRARQRERVGDVDGAAKAYREALDADRESAAIRVAYASLLADAHRVSEAMSLLREALAVDGKHVPARRLLANILLRLRSEPRGETYDREVRIAFAELLRLAPDDVEARRTLGKLAFEQGDMDEARDHFEKILAELPDDIEARLILARTYFQKRDYSRAAEMYLSLEQDLDELPARERTGQVLAYLFAERYTDAIAVADGSLKRIGEDSPEYVKLLKLRGFASAGLGDHAATLKTFEEVLRLDPGDREARFRLALACLRRRDFTRAVAELKQIRREIEESPQGPATDPPFAQVLESLGSVHMERREFREAAEALGAALRLVEAEDGLRPVIVEKLARAQFMDGQREEAMKLLSDTIDGGGVEVADFAIELAELQYKDGRDRDADRLLKRYLKEAEGERVKPALLLVIDLHQRLGHFDVCLDLLEEAQRRYPTDENVWFLLGTAHERKGSVDAAEKAFLKAIELNPSSDKSLNYLGYMLADRGIKLDQSIAYIERAVALDGHNGAYLDSLGWAQFKLGRLEPALDSLEKALAQIADDPVIYDHMAEVLVGLRRYDDALAAWQKSLDLGADEPDVIRGKMEAAGAHRTTRND